MRGTLIQTFLAVEHFASDAGACLGRSTQAGLIEGRGFHHGVERLGVITLPGLVAGFDLDFAALGDIESVLVFAP